MRHDGIRVVLPDRRVVILVYKLQSPLRTCERCGKIAWATWMKKLRRFRTPRPGESKGIRVFTIRYGYKRDMAIAPIQATRRELGSAR